jgi:hypothetical protein
MVRKKSDEMRQKIHSFHEENEFYNMMDNTRHRGRSVTVGTAYGGVVEIAIRNEFNHMWMIMQPVEAVEFLEQIAAGIGIEIAMRPKQNFTSWRSWNIENVEENFNHIKGSSPSQLESQESMKKLQQAREKVNYEIEVKKMELEKVKEMKKMQDNIQKIQHEIDNIDNSQISKKKKNKVEEIIVDE